MNENQLVVNSFRSSYVFLDDTMGSDPILFLPKKQLLANVFTVV